MKTPLFYVALLAFGLATLVTTPVRAGGPVVEDPVEVADETTTQRKGWIIPVVVGLIVLCAIACDGGSDAATPPASGCKSSGGCG